jgi:hypothetical protein
MIRENEKIAEQKKIIIKREVIIIRREVKERETEERQ